LRVRGYRATISAAVVTGALRASPVATATSIFDSTLHEQSHQSRFPELRIAGRKGRPGRLCDALCAVGLDVWFDQSALRGGDARDASIRRKIKECALFVPIISAITQVREEGTFRLEWKLAVDRSHLMSDDRTFLLPVVIDPMIDGTARVPEKFREVQWTHLTLGRGTGCLCRTRAATAVGGRSAAVAGCATARDTGGGGGGRDELALVEAFREPEACGRLFASAVIHHAAGSRAGSDAALRELAEKCGREMSPILPSSGSSGPPFGATPASSGPRLTRYCAHCAPIRGRTHSCAIGAR